MSKRIIELNFKQALEKANQLDMIASELEQDAVCVLEDATAIILDNWKSDSAEMYISKEQILKEKISYEVRDLRKCANQIRQIAKRIFDAEMKNQETAATRVY